MSALRFTPKSAWPGPDWRLVVPPPPAPPSHPIQHSIAIKSPSQLLLVRVRAGQTFNQRTTSINVKLLRALLFAKEARQDRTEGGGVGQLGDKHIPPRLAYALLLLRTNPNSAGADGS